MTMITTTEALSAVCERLAKERFVTVDTEFMRETTFWPILCVVQLAGAEEAVAVDALAPGLDLAPFFVLMKDPKVLKVFHAARQDIEIIWHLAGFVPAPLFDTQVAAMVSGHGDSISYDQLVQRLAGVQIDKSHRFTDWSRRPLSEAQIAYALADVVHLRPAYEKLAADLAKRGRSDWVSEEMAILTAPATYAADPDEAWRRIKIRTRKPRDLAVLIEVAAWRDREAQSRDVPRSRILKDDAVAEIAMQAPASTEALGRLRTIPRGFERSATGGEIVQAVKRGLARDPKTLPALEEQKAPGGGATVELLKVLLKQVSEKNAVAAKVIATSDDLDAIAADDAADVPAMKGWRRDLFGDRALALKSGRLGLAIERGRVVTFERAS